MNQRCPLCYADRSNRLAVLEEKVYWRCEVCRLVYLPRAYQLDPAEEKARYELHENDPGDESYRAFLGRLAERLLPRLTPGDRGLDYGAGPAPTLSLMLREWGHTMNTYDPYFPSDPGALDRRYDFITCTETAEHFRHPAREFRRFNHLLKAGGWLGIMTRMTERLRTREVPFENWHYRRDETHVCFYSRSTMRWIAERFGWQCYCPEDDLILFYKAHLLER